MHFPLRFLFSSVLQKKLKKPEFIWLQVFKEKRNQKWGKDLLRYILYGFNNVDSIILFLY